MSRHAAIERAPQTDIELYFALKAIWGVTVPWTKVCDDHSTPFDAFADAYFARSAVTVWWASRGFGGKSYLLSLLGLTEAAFLGARATILGGSGAQSLNVHEHSQTLWYSTNAPRHLLDGEPTKFDTHLINTGHIRSLMASQTSVRGPHPQRLRMDEIDEMELSILEAAQGQPMRDPKKPGIDTQTVMSSTWQNPQGTMTEILGRAREKNWKIHNWCWRETSNPHDGWLTQEEVDRKRTEIPNAMWEAEYDLQEPNPANRIFDQDLLEVVFDPYIGSFDGDGPFEIYEPERGGYYVTGVDWAKKKDRTIIATFKDDGESFTCVSWRAVNKTPWTTIARMAVAQWQRYGGHFVHDSLGVGDVVSDVIKEQTPRSWRRRITDYNMTGRARHDLFTEYVAGIQNQYISYPRIQMAFDEHRWVTMDDLYGTAAQGHPPDSLVAGAMAWQGRRDRGRIDVPAPQGFTKQPVSV